MNKLFTRFDNVFFEKTRLSIIMILYREGSVSFNQFKDLLGGTDGTIYAHLEKLVKENYITKKREIAGITVQTVYSITPSGEKALKEYFSFMEQLLQQQKEDSHE